MNKKNLGLKNEMSLNCVKNANLNSNDSKISLGQVIGVIQPGTLYWGDWIDWRCGNCGATTSAPAGVTPDPDSGCPNGRHAWYKE